MRQLGLFLVAALLLAGCVEQVKTISPDTLVPYTNAEHHFSISYPEGWSVLPNPEEFIAVKFDSYGEFIQVTRPLSSESLSLKELAASFVSGFKEENAAQNGGTLMVVFDGATVVHGYAAHAIVLEIEGDLGMKLKAIVIQSKKNPAEIYVVSILAPKNLYVRNSATYDAVIESFREN